MVRFLSTSGLVLYIIIACTNCNNELDDSEFVHSGIVKTMGPYSFSYDEKIRVVEIAHFGGSWNGVEIEYDGENVSRFISWVDIDQNYNLTYEYDGDKLVKSYDYPVDARDVLTITTYNEIIDLQFKSVLDSVFIRENSQWSFKETRERTFSYDNNGNLTQGSFYFFEQEYSESFYYDNLVNPFESQPFIFRGNMKIVPVLKAGKNNIAGYFSDPDQAGFPQTYTEAGQSTLVKHPIEYYKSVADVGN